MKPVSKCIESQKKYCEDNNLPLFAPSNGVCWKCRKNIYMDEDRNDEADKSHITGCPHCNKSGGRANMSRYHFNNCKLPH